MKALFGCAVNSLSSVQLAIEKALGEKSTQLLSTNSKKFSTKKVLLIPSINVLRSNIKTLTDWKGIAVVFDSPVNLISVNKLEWLDVKRDKDVLSYKFNFVEPKYDKLFEAYNSKENKKTIKIKKQDILKALVISRNETTFLVKIYNFLYFCTSHSNREMCKKLLIDFFNDKLTLAKLKSAWQDLLKPDQVDHYHREMIDWLKNSEGIRLKNAWLSLNPDKDATKVCKKFEVNIQDIRYLIRISKSNKEN